MGFLSINHRNGKLIGKKEKDSIIEDIRFFQRNGVYIESTGLTEQQKRESKNPKPVGEKCITDENTHYVHSSNLYNIISEVVRSVLTNTYRSIE